jgi:catechol 2,3-dioxygenase-like lactoylglutathione lyase family enzyme
VQFYWEVFGCRWSASRIRHPTASAHFSASAAAQSAPWRRRRCKIGWIRVPGGAVLEIFEFQPRLPPRAGTLERRGLTHISFNVRNLQQVVRRADAQRGGMRSRPERSPRGHSFFFARDFDGNLIELMDLGYMYYVLQWLGPLGGWIFRRGMYRQYYDSASR